MFGVSFVCGMKVVGSDAGNWGKREPDPEIRAAEQ